MKDEALQALLGDYLDENISHGFGSQVSDMVVQRHHGDI